MSLPATTKELNPKQLKFATLYAATGNATQAYIDAEYSPKGAAVAASKLLKIAKVAAEVARLQTEYSKAAGIDRVKVLEKLYAAFNASSKDYFNARGGILAPEDWPEEGDVLVRGYSAGTATAAEKISFTDRVRLGLDLLEEIRVHVPPALAITNNIQINNFDSLIARLRDRGEIIDVTPTT
jgi:Terminase small subunit